MVNDVKSPFYHTLITGGVLSEAQLQELDAACASDPAALLERLVREGRLSYAQLAHWLQGERAAAGPAVAATQQAPVDTEEHPLRSLDERHITDAALRQAVLARQLVTPVQLLEATREQEKTGHPLWRTLVNLRLLTPQAVIAIMKQHTDAPEQPLSQDRIVRGLLLRQRGIGEERLQALEAELQPGQSFVAAMIKRGEFSRTEIGELLSQYFAVPFIDLSGRGVASEVLQELPASFCREYAVVPLIHSLRTLTVGMVNPLEVATIDTMAMLTGKSISPVVVMEADLGNLLDRFLGPEPAGQGARAGRDVEKDPRRLTSRRMSAPTIDVSDNTSTVQLVNTIIEGAINSRATDIHLEPQLPEMRVRYRIDGMLFDIMTIPEHLQLPVVSRVKILSELDITERRLPQDGHFDVEVNGQTYNMRIATMPTKLGEKLVIRLLTESNVLTGLKQLGLEPEDLLIFKKLIGRPTGMILVTGPIGSGKTTTLYAALNELNILTNNIMTIEDPVEYRLPGINQVEVETKTGLGFADGLRSILRQDVDIIMVGEVRDQETARVAVRAALTGQQVLSTLHTADTPSAITTLHNLGIQPYLIASALSGVVAQRLVRRICASCQRSYRPSAALVDELGLREHFGEVKTLYYGEGCEQCYHTGYSGRTGIFEILRVTETLKPLIIEGRPEAQIKERALAEGTTPVAVSGLKKIVAGITTPEEVMREVFL